MNRFKFLTYFLLTFIVFGLQSCGDDTEDALIVNDIKGTWLLTHYSYKYHYFENGVWWDDSKEENVAEFIITGPFAEISGKWWDHLTFDSHELTIGLIQNHLPTRPLASQFDIETLEGQIEYNEALENWYTAIEEQNGDFPWLCPYSLKGNKLYIGTLYNGDIEFIGPDSFSLTYKDTTFDKDGEYKLYNYTFKRNS